MKVQRIRLPGDSLTWIVLDQDHLPIRPIQSYLHYLQNLEYSPNTIHNYATHLKLFWEFLQQVQLDWQRLTLEHLADFIRWLRWPHIKVIPLQQQSARRSERTINTILSAVCGFYEYQERVARIDNLKLHRLQFQPDQQYKPFLHHLKQDKLVKRRLLKLKEPNYLPRILTPDQIKQLVASCQCGRDQFLIALLYETGMRIGQALGLRHTDIRSWDNEIGIVPRRDNTNGVRAKTHQSYTIHVSKQLMQLYAQYLSTEYPEVDSDYVFINIWKGRIGQPMTYSTAMDLMRRLRKTTGIHVYAHLFRHTHATELIRNGWDLSLVQKRLGHTSVQTTANTYIHLDDADLKKAYQQFLEQQEQAK